MRRNGLIDEARSVRHLMELLAIEGLSGRERKVAEVAGRRYAFASAAYPLGQVLQGRLHGAAFAEVNVHTAAAVVIARELGIKVTDEVGNEVGWAPHRPSGALVVAWPRIHEALLRAMRG